MMLRGGCVVRQIPNRASSPALMSDGTQPCIREVEQQSPYTHHVDDVGSITAGNRTCCRTPPAPSSRASRQHVLSLGRVAHTYRVARL